MSILQNRNSVTRFVTGTLLVFSCLSFGAAYASDMSVSQNKPSQSAPSQKPDQKPSQKPDQKPSQKPSQKPNQKPNQKPSQEKPDR